MGYSLYIRRQNLNLNNLIMTYFFDWWDQIWIYFSPLCIHTIEVPPIDCIYPYWRFVTWCMIIKQEYHNTIFVTWCGIFSEDSHQLDLIQYHWPTYFKVFVNEEFSTVIFFSLLNYFRPVLSKIMHLSMCVILWVYLHSKPSLYLTIYPHQFI